MPLPVKPCEGRFNEELQEVLTRNRDRDQWANHKCEICGLEVGAVQSKGKWVPEQHWPTVKFISRNANDKKKAAASARAKVEELDVIAEVVSH